MNSGGGQGTHSTEDGQSLGFYDLELYRMFAADLYDLVHTDDIQTLLKVRSTHAWLEEVTDSFRMHAQGTLFGSPQSDIAAYKASGRIDKLTIPDAYLEGSGPIAWKIEREFSIGKYVLQSMSVRLHFDGAISLRCHCREASSVDENDRTVSLIDNAVEELRELRLGIETIAHETLIDFASVWNELGMPPKLTVPKSDLPRSQFQTYEILLFEYHCLDSDKIAVKEFAAPSNLSYLRQLVGLTRMARPFEWRTYSRQFLTQFVNEDFGSREDEYWLMNSARFLRYIPQRHDLWVNWWLQDALLAIEILLAKKAALEFVIAWTRERLLAVRHEIEAIPTARKRQRRLLVERAGTNLAAIYHLVSTVMDPLAIQRNISHGFFSLLVQRFIQAKGLDSLEEATKSIFDDLRQASQLIQDTIDTRVNIEIQQSIERLAYLAIALGLLTLLGPLYSRLFPFIWNALQMIMTRAS